jgi:hypothetical protein
LSVFKKLKKWKSHPPILTKSELGSGHT